MKNSAFDAIDLHAYDDTACFLCGATLKKATRSDEHVFPLWLQQAFTLHDQHLMLLNGTPIPYRQLKVPCCKTCNNQHLSRLEGRMKEYVLGNRRVPRPSKKDLYCWTAKIMYGIVYRELSLARDRRDPSLGTIFDRNYMRDFRNLHLALQSIRLPTTFHKTPIDFPASLFVFNLATPERLEHGFDFRDDIEHRALLLRLGKRGILAAFDSGAQEVTVGRLFRRDARRVLEPIQFAELGAKLFYKASLLKRPGKFLYIESGDAFHVVSSLPGAGSAAPIFADWHQDEYAKYVALFTGLPIAHVNPEPGLVASWLDRRQ